MQFVGTLFYDGQMVMVPQNSKVGRIVELNGATVCVEKGTNHSENLADYFRARDLTKSPPPVGSDWRPSLQRERRRCSRAGDLANRAFTKSTVIRIGS